MDQLVEPLCHKLHRPGGDWPLANCNLDLWVEFLHRRGLAPEAALGVLVRLDDEGDQFTFCKFDHGDIFRMFGLDTQELALFDRLDRHIQTQTRQGRLVMIELDAFHLPDTATTSYGREHTKTLIGVEWIDPAARRLRYLHNAGLYEAGPEDYQALLGALCAPPAPDGRIYPYTEFVRTTRPPLPPDRLRAAALAALRGHLDRAPQRNPFQTYQPRFVTDIKALGQLPAEAFHLYAFNHFRQFGAVFSFLACFVRWLRLPDTEALAENCAQIGRTAKLLQFRAARACARQRVDACETLFDELAAHWQAALTGLLRIADEA